MIVFYVEVLNELIKKNFCSHHFNRRGRFSCFIVCTKDYFQMKKMMPE